MVISNRHLGVSQLGEARCQVAGTQKRRGAVAHPFWMCCGAAAGFTSDEGGTTFRLFLLQFVPDSIGLTIHGGQEVVGHISRWLCQDHGVHNGFESVSTK
jgi:hypothetical protein